MSGEFLLYKAADGTARIQLRASDGTVWLSQRQLAELYQVSVPTINGHLRTIFGDGELSADRTIRKFRIVAREAARDVERLVDYYKLEAILLDIYATSIDYDPSAESSQVFFATVQNKMHWAAHGHTAAELIASPNASTLHTTVEPPERRL